MILSFGYCFGSLSLTNYNGLDWIGCSGCMLQVEGHRMDFKARSLRLCWIWQLQVPNQNLHRLEVRVKSSFLSLFLSLTFLINMDLTVDHWPLNSSSNLIVADGGKNPLFHEKFTIPLIEGLRELVVVVWNSNTLTFDDFIGSGK